MGDLASRLGQVDDALKHYENALTLYELNRDIIGKMNTFISLARLNAVQEKIDEAKSYYEQGFVLADSINFSSHEVVLSWRNEYQLLLAVEMHEIAPEKAQALADLLIEWVNTPNWDMSEQFLTENREKLLTEDAVQALHLLVMSNDSNQMLVQHQTILKNAIEHGIEAAYAPLKKSHLEKLQQLRQVFDHMQEPQQVQAVIAMWLMLGNRFLQQEDISHDDLKQFIADSELFVLPKAEESGEALLVNGCKVLLGWAYSRLHIQYDEQKDYPQALAAISKAIEYRPENAMYYHNRAVTYMDMEDYANALPDLEKAQELEPDAQRLPKLWKQYNDGIGESSHDDEN
ncbi:MAG: tetratricopeptide repeat protein [Chloroflexi bacterium]|nr:MAG: tetratricopeptide repeat protein [Chloroflexota bacterium]